MITKEALQEAIAECQGVRDPKSNTVIILAALFIILDHMYPSKDSPTNEQPNVNLMRSYSFDAGEQTEKTIDYTSGTDFSLAVDGKREADVLPIIDELMEMLKSINRPLYNAVLRKINSL